MHNAFEALYRRYYSDYEPYDAFLFHAREQLAGISLAGKRVLEIGCGRGAFSLYMALTEGARTVIALDEAAGYGADKHNLQKLQNIVERHTLHTIEIMQADIAASSLFPEDCFDLIVSNFAIHHSVPAHRKEARKEAVPAELVHIFHNLNSYLRSGGMVILREMSGINFWRFMPYRWKMSHVEWHLHPSLRQWKRALMGAGFRAVRHSYLTPFFLSKWPSPVVRNRCTNFFCSSTFYLYGTK